MPAPAVERHDAQNVLDGDLDDFIKAFLLGAQEEASAIVNH